jgi:hypothetical protein
MEQALTREQIDGWRQWARSEIGKPYQDDFERLCRMALASLTPPQQQQNDAHLACDTSGSPTDTQGSGMAWQPIASAPKDGTLLLLLLDADNDRRHPLEDTAGASRTVGHNNFDHDGVDEWCFAGWTWEQDYYVQGEGNPVAWMHYPAALTPDVGTPPAVSPRDEHKPAVSAEQMREAAAKACMDVARKTNCEWRACVACSEAVRSLPLSGQSEG